MKELEERIRRDGTVKTGDVLKVDAFLNHQCDVRLFDHMGQEWARHFAGKTITKILTIEASGIGIACCAARHFGDVPVVFAKKAQSINLDGDQYTTTVYSFTKRKEFPVIVSKSIWTPTTTCCSSMISWRTARRCTGSSSCAMRRGRVSRESASRSRRGSRAAVTNCARRAMTWIRCPSSSP